MTGPEFSDIRKRLDLTAEQWGRALGLSGTRNTVQGNVRLYARGKRELSLTLERLAEMYERHGVPEGWAHAPGTVRPEASKIPYAGKEQRRRRA